MDVIMSLLSSLERHYPDPYGTSHHAKWSFSKASRFRVAKAASQADFISAPTTFSRSHSPGMGYGKRWEPKNPAGKDSPSEVSYLTKSCFDLSLFGPFGPTFARASKRAGKRDLPHTGTPGPGHYPTARELGQNAPKYSMQSKHLTRYLSNTPSPGHYSPNNSVVESSCYAGTSFGHGNRSFLSKLGTEYVDKSVPGPGTYDLPSCFHRKTASLTTATRLPVLKSRYIA